MQLKEFNKKISFIDDLNHKAIIEIELTHRNKYDEFTMSGRYCGSCGQCIDEIKPKTQAQKELVKFWQDHHLKEIKEKQLKQIQSIIKTIEAEEEKREQEEAQKEKTEDEKILNQMEEYGIDEDMIEACKAYLSNFCDDTDLTDFEESYQGEYYSEEQFAEELANELGYLDNTLKWPYNCINWEQASRDLMMDHWEADGHYFRSM